MVYVRVWGGLGNQMFQYAYARALQLRTGGTVRLCLVPEQGKGTARQYGLDKLDIRIARDPKFERAALLVERHEALKGVARTVSGKLAQDCYIEEKTVRFDERLMHIKGNCYISGFMQNENYFKDYGEVIRKEVRPKGRTRIPDGLKHILDTENTVSVHIRRTDYKRYGNLLDREYYGKAMELMRASVGDAFYMVFSDDLKWVKENMQFGNRAYFVNEDRRLEDYEELFVMGKCKHNIIANSTFSWWGAWLNRNKGKTVVGPERWFSNSRLNIMPDAWLRV